VGKYIGETEKNLKRVFERAAASGSPLLFDEADALFGKRTQVKDAHDRFANLAIDYLLEQIEAHAGLVILVSQSARPLAAVLRRRLTIRPFPPPRARLCPTGIKPVEDAFELSSLGDPKKSGAQGAPEG
jgi:SpoVK/Ycf46/Vps4 family AAA+-type ATPase